MASRGGIAWWISACASRCCCARASSRSRAASTDCSSTWAGMTKPGGTGNPRAVIAARLAPLPPARRTSRHVSSLNQRIAVSLIDNPHGAHRRRRCANPLDRKDRELEVAGGKLIQVDQVFDMPVILIHHHHMRFPELFALKHCPDRRIEGYGIGAHQSNAARDQVARRLGGHAAMVGQVALL